MPSPSVHQSALIIDFHCDSLLEARDGSRSLTVRSDHGHIDLPRLREAGVTAQVFALWAAEPELRPRSTVQAIRLLEAFYTAVDESHGAMRLATTAADIERCKADGVVCGVLSLEGAEPLSGELSVLRMFYRLGVRALGLTWNHRNEAADGVGEARTGGGLTEFGVALVEELDRLGMLLDISHLSPRGVQDVLQVSRVPIIASHANAWSVCRHRRNLSDEQLEAVARTGGVVGVVFYRDFVDDDPEKATLDRVVDHVDYLVSVIGADHVGLGSDFDGFMGDPAPVGLEDVTRLPALTQKLIDRGYTPETIKQILGGNWLRVLKQVVG
jgi:membrane dipeptidase